MVTKMSDPEEWNAQFEAIDLLRIMNKYHFDTLMENLHCFTKFLKDSIENLRSGISKNALMFTTEFLGSTGNKNKEQMIKFIEEVSASILFKTVYDKLFINKEAKTSINHALNHCFYKEFLTILI